MIEIIPAILPSNFEELERELVRLRGLPAQAGVLNFVQVDLVGNNILAGRETFPLWEEFDFECDIMLPNPEREVQACIDIGAARIVVHALEALEILQPYRGGEYPIAAGFALAAHDSPEKLKNLEKMYDFVQVMGIENVGSQGQPPDPKAVELVRVLRAAHPRLVIQVDGAVAPRAREFARAGANRLVIGSAIIRAENPSDAYKQLYTEANALG
ncbi:hypothetical protein A2852_01695 [Candidatus Adlerbacteria bacterium RIFCSPHIGHO2_01_FULL_54_23]|uniref:Ribulose-phosphate 3-epimerase n=3 Tax=Candidatus Adleribacteriota TaxID=1752736 RepID=A0A1F4XZJ4_9BACT|nr:MAG: hypothetical protein UY83_C0010G0009 [Candidatus Adlerbacteria bacterium GW2011_GWA1_54_10]KKW38037.1 MAG: hypothetical protein UY86_C0001G0010 [Candidatus Adlerbacteria bacterium GW2011_GWB1_54_7]OGC79454.1 MAG: hypothetical protein A2852_01695 [Candidatus Adlerbacteria bacterium RIFCSPHIGHO2_01_FULL_54_23]OGC87064.1 MAG: hypothetical protein A3B33_00355 [Candidatus Adlerbacteria bacterium RIFCSPLOWO2_01_FULL_54_16]